MTNEQTNEQVVVDEQKAARIHMRVFSAVSKNLATNEKTTKQMIDDIKDIIETEVKKCY